MKPKFRLSLYPLCGVILFFCVLFNISCIHQKKISQESGLDGRLSIILDLSSQGEEEIFLTFEGAAIKNGEKENPVFFPLKEKFMLSRSPRQFLLGDFPIWPSQYKGIILTIKEAFLFSGEQLMPLHVKERDISIDMDLVVEPWERKSILIKLICGIEKGVKERSLIITNSTIEKERTVLRGLKAYVTDERGNCVWIFDRFSGATLESVSVGERPRGIVISPDGRKVYIANSGADTISVLDTLNKEVTDTILLGLGVGPEGIVITPDGRMLITANVNSNNISLIDLDSKRVIEHISVGQGPSRVAVSPWGDWAYVSNSRSNDLRIVSLNTREVVSTIATLPGPAGVTVNPSGDEIYVACDDSDAIQVIDGNLRKVVNVFPTGSKPVDLILHNRRGRIYCANSQSNDVSILLESMNMTEAVIPVGTSPNALALDDARGLLYVVNQGDGTVSVIDLGKQSVVETIKVGTAPWGITIDKFGAD